MQQDMLMVVLCIFISFRIRVEYVIEYISSFIGTNEESQGRAEVGDIAVIHSGSIARKIFP